MKSEKLLRQVRDQISRRNTLREEHVETQERLAQCETRLQNILHAREVLKKVALLTQGRLEYRISSLVSTALSAVFDDPYEFTVRFVERRNKMECDLFFVKDGEEYNPLDASGGGTVDVASFALRIAYWSLRKNRKTFVLDEPFKFLSAGHHEKASEMMKMLSDKLGVQFIMVSHLKEMIGHADKVFEVVNGKVKEVIEV